MPIDLYNNSTYQGDTITDKIQNRLAELNKANPFSFSSNVFNTIKNAVSPAVQPVNNIDNSSTLSVYYNGNTIQDKIQNRLNELNEQTNTFSLPKTPEIKQGVLANYPQALKETAISGLKAIPKIFFPAITNFVKKSTGIIGESLAYAIDPLVREQYKEGNQDILPNVSATSPTDMLKDTFAAGLEASIYKIIPSTLKISIVKRFGVGALQGVGFAVSQGLANDETPEQILDNAKTYGKYGAAIEVVAPYLLPLLKTELRNIPQGVKNTFKGLAQETSNVPVGLSIKGDEVGWKYNDKLRKELIKITNLAYTSLDSPVGAVIRHWEEKKLPTNSIIEQVKELIKKSKGNANKNLLELENKLKLSEVIGEVKPLAQEATPAFSDLTTNVLKKFKAEDLVKTHPTEIQQAIKNPKGKIYDEISLKSQDFDISNRKSTGQQAIKLTPEIKARIRGEAPTLKQPSGTSPFGKAKIGPMAGIGAGATGVLATLATLKGKNKEVNAKTYAEKIASVKMPTSKELVPGETEYNVVTKERKYKPLLGELKSATLTVYNPEKEQTDETPDIGGFSTKMEFGDVAVGNRNEYDKAKSKFSKDKTDTFIFIPELEKVKTPYGDGIFRVRDTMKITNDGKNMLDIFIPNAGSNTEKTVRNTPKATYAYLKI